MASLIGRWTRATILGELLGFIAPTLVGVVFFLALGEPEGAAAWLAPLAAAVGGAGEGAVLGAFQGRVLATVAPVTRKAWTLATMWGAVVAWACGMSAPLLAPQGPVGIIAAVLLGIIGLAALAVFQWRLLRPISPGARWWVPGSMGAWAAGVALVIVAMAIVPGGAPWWAWAGAGIVGAVPMGAAVGAATGWLLRRVLDHRPDARGSSRSG